MADPGFQYSQWQALFPALATQAGPALPPMLYRIASEFPAGSYILNNPNLSQQAVIDMMNLFVAHLTWLWGRDAGAVGMLSDASEGSVSTSFSYPSDQGALQAWFGQSQWGAMLYQMLAPSRQGHYVPGPGGRYPNSALLPNILQPGNKGLFVGNWP